MEVPIISKTLFNRFKHLLPLPRGNKKLDDKVFIRIVFYVVKTNMCWEQVPEKYGKWNSIYRRFLRWSAKGIFEKIFRHFGKKIKRNTAMLDSTM